jgi:hypothetical protein
MVQSLIEQLQLGAVDGSSPIADVLRKAKLAAVKLKAIDFAAWVDLEMNGYTDRAALPRYRHVRGSMKFLNPYHGWLAIIGLENLEQPVFQPVGELSLLLRGKSGFLTVTAPEPFRRKICSDMDFNCQVSLHVASTSIGAVVEAVRNNVLEWTLKLEQAGIHGHGLSFTPEETKAAQAMNVTHNYHGPVASVAHGSNTIKSIAQTNASATSQQIADALAALIKAVPAGPRLASDTADAVSDLTSAEQELREGRVPFGKITRAVEWLGKAEDMALRAPEVASKLHQLAQMCGLA